MIQQGASEAKNAVQLRTCTPTPLVPHKRGEMADSDEETEDLHVLRGDNQDAFPSTDGVDAAEAAPDELPETGLPPAV